MATKINYEKSINTLFNEIEEGEIFSQDNCLFIRAENEFQDGFETLNAICLDDGTLVYFAAYDEVQKVNVEINVKFI